MSRIGLIIWKDLGNIENWQIGMNTALHKPSGISFWAGSSGWFFDGYSDGKDIHILGLFERHILWWKYKRMIRQDVVARYFPQLK